ncbi:MAG TPA: tRNA pseudouridine(38-40) synthase TruA [bacterium]
MPTLKLTVAYDGTRYAGWQRQSGSAGARPTVQETLERALGTILRERVRVVGSGRTDAGVHALAQVAHARVAKPVSCARLRRSLQALLPGDLAVLRVEEAAKDFHARFDAKEKRYRYRIFTGPVPDPFARPYVHHVRAPLNAARMRREAAALRGRHDFRALARAGHGRRSTVRVIRSVGLRRRGEELWLEVIGSGFLHAMVRSIAGTLIDVGRGRLPAGTLPQLLRAGRRGGAGTTAPARGLVLVSVRYREGRHERARD